MKVNMALVSDEESSGNVKAPPNAAKPVAGVKLSSSASTEPDTEPEAETEGEEDELDNSDKHSKLKTFLLVAAMVGGFGLFVWNMTGLVNNMRLDNQGVPNISYEYNINDFAGGGDDEGQKADEDTDIDQTESEVSTDAARDGPGSEDPGNSADPGSQTQYANESEEMAALRKEAQDARNEAALVKQELKNAEDMLDSSLQREAELQNQLDALAGRN